MLIEMTWLEIILKMLVFGLALGGIVLGAVAMYFGSKGTRKLGKVLLGVGLAVFIILAFPWPITLEGAKFVWTGEFAWQGWQIGMKGIWDLVGVMVLGVIGGAIGAVIMGIALLIKALS
jgi:hypothetical protein